MKQPLFLPVVFIGLMSSSVIAHENKTHSYSTEMSRSQSENERMNAIDIILQDHDHIRHMFSEVNKKLDSNIDECRAKFAQLKDFIIKHETMEQKVWYPELEKHDNLKPIIAHLKKEEKKAGMEIKKLDKIKDNKEWAAKVKKLEKAVEHHAHEEESKLLPKVKKDLDRQTLEEIGGKLKNFKAENDMKY